MELSQSRFGEYLREIIDNKFLDRWWWCGWRWWRRPWPRCRRPRRASPPGSRGGGPRCSCWPARTTCSRLRRPQRQSGDPETRQNDKYVTVLWDGTSGDMSVLSTLDNFHQRGYMYYVECRKSLILPGDVIFLLGFVSATTNFLFIIS